MIRLRRGRSPLVTMATVVAFGAFLLPACKSPEAYRQEADDETYALIEERRAELFGNQNQFRIDAPENSLRQQLLDGTVKGLPPLTLSQCLEIAAENNRTYQDRKEQLYQTALNLTLERWRFETNFGASISGTVTGTGEEATNAEVQGGFNLSRLLGTGAQIVTNLGSSLFRALATSDGWDALSDISISMTQPILQGAGRAIVMEPLTQAERDLVYEVRSFERFRRTFAVNVASQVYRLILAIENLRNEEANADSLEEVRLRNEALAQAGQLSDLQVDEARQDELQSINRLLELQQDLDRQLDDFKLLLGLPIDVEINLDEQEIATLRESLENEDPVLGRFNETRIFEIALVNRLDYLTSADQVFDNERQVLITEDALRAGLDLEGSLNAATPEGQPASFRSGGVGWSAGFQLDLPIDQLPERNAYRRAIIAWEAAKRDLILFEDEIRANLRDQLRRAETTKASYEIQTNAVKLAGRRVESARLNLEAGRVETRVLLDAQEDLLAAANAESRALIDYALAVLDLYVEMEILIVDQRGISVENSKLAENVDEGP